MNRQTTLQDEADRGKQLMLLMVQHQRRIFAFIYTLVPDRHQAEDLLQETCLVICEKFIEFKPGTDFVAWACQIALWRVRAARQKFARSKIVFDDQLVEQIAQTAVKSQGEFEARHAALEKCLKKLPARDRELVMTRYQPGGTVANAAQKSGRSLVAGYKALGRIRHVLLECVNRQLAKGAPS